MIFFWDIKKKLPFLAKSTPPRG